MRALGEILRMTPAQARVRRAVALIVTGKGELAVHEPVEPAVLHLTIDLHPTRIALRRPRSASPVESKLRVQVIVDREVVTEVLDVAAVGRAVAKQLTDAEARRENTAAATRAHVLENEGEPHDRHVADVQYRRPGDHDVLRDHFDLV